MVGQSLLHGEPSVVNARFFHQDLSFTLIFNLDTFGIQVAEDEPLRCQDEVTEEVPSRIDNLNADLISASAGYLGTAQKIPTHLEGKPTQSKKRSAKLATMGKAPVVTILTAWSE